MNLLFEAYNGTKTSDLNQFINIEFERSLKSFEIIETEKEIYVRSIVLKRSHKGKGIGSQIMEFVKRYAQSKKKFLRLIVVGNWRERNKLHRFYTRLEFTYRMNEQDQHEYYIDYGKKD